MTMNPEERIIVALDVENREKAISLAENLDPAAFKVGLRLFTAEGPDLLHELNRMGKRIFLDLKLHDIPNTVADAVRSCAGYRAAMMTIHTSGGKEMMRRASEAAAEEAEKLGIPRPLLMGVTVLTSLKGEQLKEIGMVPDTYEQVLRLANLAAEAGMDGVVCSPQEIDIVKKEIGRDFMVVAPGIRPAWAAAQDQKRIMTPSKAVKKGADYLVIGRPIIQAPSPNQAFEKIVAEIRESQ